MAQTPVMRRGATTLMVGSRRAPLPRTMALSRTYASFSKTKASREMSKMISAGPKQPTMSVGFKEAAKTMFADGNSPLFPATFVAVPLSRYPRSITDFFRYQWFRSLSFIGGKLTVWGNQLDSMPGWTSRPRYRPRTRQLATTAKVMYRETLEAFAAGDIEALQRLCTPSYGQRMIAAIGRRDPKEELHFEVVKYHKPWLFPKLKSHQIRAANELEPEQLTEQVVVAISSTQRLTKRNKTTGQMVPGTMKVQDKTEFVVLSRNVDKSTWEMEPWKVWGTISDTPLEKYLADRAETEEKQDQHVKWKNSVSKR